VGPRAGGPLMPPDERRPEEDTKDMPPVERDTPARDPNLEEQTVQSEEPGPGASKMEAMKRMEKQVRIQEERTKRDQGEEEGEE
jgi:hypothetical protein